MSSGGGDGGAQQRATQDEERKAAARDRVNAIFGIAPANRTVTTTTPAVSPRGRWTTPERMGPQFIQDAPGSAAVTRTEVNPLGGIADTNKTARDALYQTTADNAFDLNKSSIDREHDLAQRKNKFQLFRQGLAGGSTDADQQALLGEATDRATLGARSAADTVGNDFRSADEQTRLDILRQISGGLDANSAIQSGIRGMQLSSDRANQAARMDLGAGALDDAGLLYQAQQKAAGMRQGRDWYSKVYSPSTAQAGSFSGTRVS